MFCYGPWFAVGAIAWTRLAWRYTRVPAAATRPTASRRCAIPASGGLTAQPARRVGAS
jgi:hypothetical protein